MKCQILEAAARCTAHRALMPQVNNRGYLKQRNPAKQEQSPLTGDMEKDVPTMALQLLQPHKRQGKHTSKPGHIGKPRVQAAGKLAWFGERGEA